MLIAPTVYVCRFWSVGGNVYFIYAKDSFIHPDWFQMMTAVILKNLFLGLVYKITVRYQSETEKLREKNIYIWHQILII